MKRLILILMVIFACPVFSAYAADRIMDSLLLPVRHVFFKDKDSNSSVNAHVIEVDLMNPRLKLGIALPYNSPNKQANVKALAEGYKAVAAINGSFFHIGKGVAAPVGLIMLNGDIISDSRHRRTSLGITDKNEIIFDIPKITISLSLPEKGKTLKVSGVNQMRRYHQTIIYTSYFGKYTHTNNAGREIIVRGGIAVGYSYGNTEIPADGFIISIHGASKGIQDLIPLGSTVVMDVIKSSKWESVKTIITGGPFLVHNGKVYNTYYQEKMNPTLKAPNTRSAIGITHNKKVLFITVSGKVTYTRLAQILKRLGAVEAMGLDGGGSTGLYMNGKIMNRDSYTSRPVSNALIITVNK